MSLLSPLARHFKEILGRVTHALWSTHGISERPPDPLAGLTPKVRMRLESEDGRNAEWEPLRTRPLGLDDVFRLQADERAALPIEHVARDVVVDGVVHQGYGTVTVPIEFNHPILVFALVEGGWLPWVFAEPRRFLVDRNVLSALTKLRSGTQWKDEVAFGAWLSVLPATTLNPLPCAFEGDTRQTPSYEAFVAAFADAVETIERTLPQVQVVRFQEPHFRAAYDMVQDLGRRRGRESKFLLDVMPHLVYTTATSDLLRREGEIIDAAVARGLSRCSLVVLSALSCLYEDTSLQNFSIGRKLLKPRSRYDAGDAYNALADLTHLELFIAGMAVPGIERSNFCTMDKALVAFWCALAPEVVDGSGPGIRFTVCPQPSLFPRLPTGELHRLQAQLE